jgi:2-alkyl-3-oxoalkanoate reductase
MPRPLRKPDEAFQGHRMTAKPTIGEGQGVWNFVQTDDAPAATAAALECPPDVNNLVDEDPSPQHVWLSAFSRTANAPAPPKITEQDARASGGPDGVYYTARPTRAPVTLNFRPRRLEWL